MKPTQFDFQLEWDRSIRAIRFKPSVVQAMEVLKRRWLDTAEFSRDEMKAYDPTQADLEFELDLFTFEVKRWDLHWLRSRWDAGSFELAEFSFRIAEALFPLTNWQLIDEVGSDYFVTADVDREIVFDMGNFDKIGAGASLLLAQDRKCIFDEADAKEVENYHQQRIETMQNALNKIRSDIDATPA